MGVLQQHYFIIDHYSTCSTTCVVHVVLHVSNDLLKSPESPKSPLKSPPNSPLNLLKCGFMVYIIPQFIIISYISIVVCMIL